MLERSGPLGPKEGPRNFGSARDVSRVVSGSEATSLRRSLFGAAVLAVVGATLLLAAWVVHVQPLPALEALGPSAIRFGAPVRIVPDTSGCRWTMDAWHRAVGVSHVPAGDLRELAAGLFCKDDALIEADALDEVVRLDRYTWRPVGPRELELIAATGYRRFPPRLAHQPIFYPACNERYAIEIAERWNVKASGSGFVTRFAVRSDVGAKYPKQVVGAPHHEELWVPAEDLDAFNDAIVRTIEVVRTFGAG